MSATMMTGDKPLFYLTLKLYGRLNERKTPLIIHVYDGGNNGSHHRRLDVEVKLDNRLLFKRGETWCAIPNHWEVKGNRAKELVLALLAMTPNDSYTPVQKAFHHEFGDELDCIRQERYCLRDGS